MRQTRAGRMFQAFAFLGTLLGLLLAPAGADAQQDADAEVAGELAGARIIRGGWLFDVDRGEMVPNTGIVVRAGKFMEVGAELEGRDLSGAQILEISDQEYILPGFFDLHAHYAVELFGAGRVDETEVYPILFLANGVTSTFPAGEMEPEKMRALRLAIERGELPGPRIFSSGPYFGTARPGWDPESSPDAIRREVDAWADKGVRGFKAKGIRPEQLQALIEAAHQYGLTVTAHLGSGYGHSVNPGDAILMGIDRVEHFLGGELLPADRPAYASLEQLDPESPRLQEILELYKSHRVFFDATLTAYGYFGAQDPSIFEDFAVESRFLTRHMQSVMLSRPPRRVSEQFERIFRIKLRTLKAFYDAGGGPLITLGTDHPSWGQFFSPFGVHREMHAMVQAGIPPADVLRIATINGARALGVADRLGSIEPGKWADLVIVRGNPLEEIRNTRHVRFVLRGGAVFPGDALLASAEGKIGPRSEEEEAAWRPSRP